MQTFKVAAKMCGLAFLACVYLVCRDGTNHGMSTNRFESLHHIALYIQFGICVSLYLIVKSC